MFAKTVTASEFRENLKKYLELVKGKSVLQLIHRGEPVRVVMTQDYFFSLLSRLSEFEQTPSSQLIPDVPPQERIKKLRSRLRKHGIRDDKAM